MINFIGTAGNEYREENIKDNSKMHNLKLELASLQHLNNLAILFKYLAILFK